MIGHEFPYLDTRDLNLDWLLKNMKQLLQDWATYQQTMNQDFADLQAAVDQFETDITTAFDNLHDYVEDYFDNLDVQQEINNKLNAMKLSGELAEIMNPLIATQTATWLSTHITNPSNPPIDTSLSVSGAAADAKTTGDRLTGLSNSLDDVSNQFTHAVTTKTDNFDSTDFVQGVIGSSGATGNTTHAWASTRNGHLLSFLYDTTISVTEGYKFVVASFDAEGTYQSKTDWLTDPYKLDTLHQYKFTIGEVTEGTAEFDLATWVSKLSVSSSLVEQVNENTTKVNVINTQFPAVKNQLDDISNQFTHAVTTKKDNFNASDFTQGSINNSGSTGSTTHAWASTRNGHLLSFLYDTTISVTEGYKFVVASFDAEGTYQSKTDWLTDPYKLDTLHQYKFTIGEVTEGTAEFDLATWVSKLSVSSSLVNQVNENTYKIDNMSFDFPSITDLFDLQDGKKLIIKGVNHRGYNTVAPENSLPAYRLSKQHNFNFVETDVWFTADSVPVLIHNRQINNYARNPDGTELTSNRYVDQLTLAELQEYDWGIYKSQTYAGLKLATFAEFIPLCKELGLHPYIEIKDHPTIIFTDNQLQSLVDIVKANDMERNVTWISFNADYLDYIGTADIGARLGLLTSAVATDISKAIALKASGNPVFVDSNQYSSEVVTLCKNAGLPLEYYTSDSEDFIKALPSYISGVTSNTLIAGLVIYNANIGDSSGLIE